MVRLSKRRVNINKITSIVKFRLQYRREREEIGIMDEEEDEVDERIFLLYRLKKGRGTRREIHIVRGM